MSADAVDHVSPVEAPAEALAGVWVSRGARVTGAVADAVVTIDADEHRRRAPIGLHGVTELGLLDALMCLPAGATVSTSDVGEIALWHLRRAPTGCVEWPTPREVSRVVVPACSVDLVVVRAASWRPALRCAAAFEPFARRVVLFEQPPRTLSDVEWEADAAGVGVWIRGTGGDVEEVMPPAPFVRRYVKPSGWRFTERAYSTWVAAEKLTPTGR